MSAFTVVVSLFAASLGAAGGVEFKKTARTTQNTQWALPTGP
jgi:hypothetical protein